MRLTLSCWAVCLVAQSCLTLCDPMGCSPPGSSVHGILQARRLECSAMPSSRGSSQPRDQTQVCRQILYQLSHQRNLKTLAWVAYPFSRGIFPTQELNGGLLHCRWILYKLSYQQSPLYVIYHTAIEYYHTVFTGLVSLFCR